MLLAVNSRQRFISSPIFHFLDGTSGFVTGGIHQLNVDLTPLWVSTAQVKITTPIKMEVLHLNNSFNLCLEKEGRTII